jgi:hypothetical protein
MNKTGKPMMRAYWNTIGGTLVEDFCEVKVEEFCTKTCLKTCTGRLIDGIILPNLVREAIKAKDFDKSQIDGEEVIVVQTSSRFTKKVHQRLTTSHRNIRYFNPKSIISVALVTETETDSFWQQVFESLPNRKIVVV